ncbi:hypothetical protein B0H66DRAFT_473176, partial [Apodospora peruviana]
LFPAAVRERYRERFLSFRFEILPRYKHRLQSRIYRYIVERQQRQRQRSRDQNRLVDRVRRQSRRVLFGTSPKEPLAGRSLPSIGDANALLTRTKRQRTHAPDGKYGAPAAGGGNGNGGGRRKKLAAMAGSLYRAGAAAASEIKEQYNNTRIRGVESPDTQISIPRSFPQVSIIHKGEEQMVLFPSYAKRHVKEYGQHSQSDPSMTAAGQNSGAMKDAEYWRHEWAKVEDEKAVVDVDVRGWIYMPSKGPMTRRNRMLIGLARRLSGIPAPTVGSSSEPQSPVSTHEEHERLREERRIAKEAREIERRGQTEKDIAAKGGYSEQPKADDDSETEPDRSSGVGRSGSGTQTPVDSAPPSPTLIARPSFVASELPDAELATANANLMARIGPFMTTPLVELPITIFFYNDEQSQSRTVETNDSGHFVIRAPLDFVPTHVRVLVNEDISATQPVQIIEPDGVSLISDIDDTIKRSNISLGAREIFRNTFIRELADLTIDGVKEWYNSLHDMGVKVHYCSNSPWQLFPVLATFFHTAGLPPGSIHLKQYSGMLQGIFEPVAERKKGTLERILRDFPERRFLLVGDSGEADLEVYTELAVANPGRILAVFIRDVTTPDDRGPGYFDFSLDRNSGGQQQRSRQSTKIKFEDEQQHQPEKDRESRPDLPPRIYSAPAPQQRQHAQQQPAMGTLIDFSDEPEPISPKDTRKVGQSTSALDLLAGKKAPPPRPAKPKALRSAPKSSSATSLVNTTPALGRNNATGGAPFSFTANPKSGSTGTGSTPPPPPPLRRRGTPSLQGQQQQLSREPAPPPPQFQRRSTNSSYSAGYAGHRHNHGSDEDAGLAGGGNAATMNKKMDLWRRRLARAHEILGEQGVPLYTWRRGEDVIKEAEGIVRDAMERMKQGKR